MRASFVTLTYDSIKRRYLRTLSNAITGVAEILVAYFAVRWLLTDGRGFLYTSIASALILAFMLWLDHRKYGNKKTQNPH